MESNFDTANYLQTLITMIKSRADQTSGKLYIEVNGKLLKDDFASRVFPGYESEIKRKLIQHFKTEAEILICVNAQYLINNPLITKKKIAYLEHLELTLKRIETATGIKPHLVITHINMEEMYDIIFRIESKFQKKGYRVREQYLQKGFPINKRLLLSENWFGNDDHIPIMKKIVFVSGIGEESGKLAACIGQIYRDHEIWIASSFCMLQTLPVPEISSTHLLHQAWQKKTNEPVQEDKSWASVSESSAQSFSIIKELLNEVVEENNLISNYQTPSAMLICPTYSAIKNLDAVEQSAARELAS